MTNPMSSLAGARSAPWHSSRLLRRYASRNDSLLIKGRWYYNGLARTDEGFFDYFKPRVDPDVNFNYCYTNLVGFFLNARNLTHVAQDAQRAAFSGHAVRIALAMTKEASTS
jgi:hypothetical protein